MSSIYAVVEFVGEQSVALAAESWLVDNETSVMWPPYKSQTRVDKAVKKREPPTDGYQKFPCRVLYKTSSYEKGLAKVRKAEDISDLATDAECAGIPVKRKSRPNPRYQDSDSSSDEDRPGPSHTIQRGNQQKHHPAATSAPKTPPRALPSPPSSLISQWPAPVCTATEKKILTMLEEVKIFQAENRAMLISICRKLDNYVQGEYSFNQWSSRGGGSSFKVGEGHATP
ncbi:uncharacterized protein LOC119734137 [Patiria miniata]|uniref:Uncharacterized protein n=1 Tax=Patiria miniata TaxID=46514 RepID=A0A914AJ39_PATMI|nr:uncharacterized protein LOC119734137 [Patiria miniata]